MAARCLVTLVLPLALAVVVGIVIVLVGRKR